MSYIKKVIDKNLTSQSEKVDERQVKNSAGGYSFQVDNWMRFNRFLILGTEGGAQTVGATGGHCQRHCLPCFR